MIAANRRRAQSTLNTAHAALRTGGAMTRNNVLYLIIGALAVGVAVLGYNVYQDRKEPKGVQINLGEKGLSIQKK